MKADHRILLVLRCIITLSSSTKIIIEPHLVRLATRFHGSRCQRAIAAENATRWNGLCEPRGPLCVFPGGSQDAVTGVVTAAGGGAAGNASGTLAVYVRNQKAGSDMVFNSFRSLFNLSTVAKRCYVGSTDVGQKKRVGPNQHDPCFPSSFPSVLLFTMVRDPAKTALSAYLELRFRARYRDPRAGRAAFEALFSGTNNNSRGDKSCASNQGSGGGGAGGEGDETTGDNEATRDFLMYLEAIERGEKPLGREAYHAWPQALKLERSALHRRYDAIGRLENARADLLSLRAALLPYSSAAASSTPSALLLNEHHHHSHAAASCGEVDIVGNARVARALCRIYSVDYECFGATIPQACRKKRRLYKDAP